MEEAIIIQKNWRAFQCRRKVIRFSQLLSDVWNIILSHFTINKLYTSVDKIIKLRLLRLYWGAPLSQMKTKMQTVKLVQKYLNCLTNTTVTIAFKFFIRLLRYSHMDSCSNLMVNSCMEEILKKHLCQLVRDINL